MRDIYEIGVLIEPALTRWFVGMATHEDIAELERIQALIEANDFSDPLRHSELDTAVPHRDVRAPLQPACRRTVVEAPRGAARRQPALQFHAGPARRGDARAPRTDRLVKAGDADKAATLIAHHVDGSGRHILEQMRASMRRAQARFDQPGADRRRNNSPEARRQEMKITGVKPWLVKASSPTGASTCSSK